MSVIEWSSVPNIASGIQRPVQSDQRIHRVCALIVLLGLLNVYDLNMTVKAIDHDIMFEANPIAAMVIDEFGSLGVRIFKSTLLGFAMVFLLIGRRTATSEYGALLGVTIYLGVACLWLLYPMDVLIAQSQIFFSLAEEPIIPQSIIPQ